MQALWRYMALFVLMLMVKNTLAVSLNLCSGMNTASGSANYSQFQTNGLCSDFCSSTDAFSITQGNNCWCSDYAPGKTVSTSSCDEPCPGYPYEYCGAQGLFGYVALNNKPAGTMGASTSTPQETSQATSSYSSSSTTTWTSSSTSSDQTTETVTRSPVTSVVTLPGQTQVSTIVVTPSSAATADSSPLGQGASHSTSNNLSKGAVAGLAVGVFLGVSAIAAAIIFFLWRRMKQHREEAEASLSPEMAGGGSVGTPSSVSRHTSTMSQSGLLGKNPRLNTRNLSNGWGSQAASAGSATSPTGTGNRRSLGADQRLDPSHAIYTNEDLRHSDVSLQDNTDYSRKILSVRNRGDGEIDDD